MSAGSHDWPTVDTDPVAHAQFMNIDKEMKIMGATDNPRDTVFDG